MATFVPYLIALYCLSLVHAQSQMEIERHQTFAAEDDFELPKIPTECPAAGPLCTKYNAQSLGGCWCKCSRPTGGKYTFFEPTNSCLKVSLARQRSGCDLLFTGKTADGALSFIPSTGVTNKIIKVPANKTCSFYFGEKLYAHYLDCDGAWKEISSSSVNESLDVTPGWNTSQLQLATRGNILTFLLLNPGRIFRVAVQCRYLHNNTVDSTCVMFKVEGRIRCPIPQQTPLNQSATLPPPIVEIISTTAIPTRPTTTQTENVTTGTPAVFTTEAENVTTGTPAVVTTEAENVTTGTPAVVTTEAENVTTGTPAVVTTEAENVTTGTPAVVTTEAENVTTGTPAVVTTENMITDVPGAGVKTTQKVRVTSSPFESSTQPDVGGPTGLVDTEKPKSQKKNTYIIAGAVAGSILLIALVLLIAWRCSTARKRGGSLSHLETSSISSPISQMSRNSIPVYTDAAYVIEVGPTKSMDNPTYRRVSDGVMVGPEIKQKPDYADVFPSGAPPRPPVEKRNSVNGHMNPALTLKEEVVTMNPLFEGKDHDCNEEKVVEEDLKNADEFNQTYDCPEEILDSKPIHSTPVPVYYVADESYTENLPSPLGNGQNDTLRHVYDQPEGNLSRGGSYIVADNPNVTNNGQRNPYQSSVGYKSFQVI